MSSLLSEYTTLEIGGAAEKILIETDQLQLIYDSIQLKKDGKKFLIIGSGSNLLISDEGYPGTVIVNKLKGIKRDGHLIKVKSGTLLQDLVDFANQSGLKGLQTLAGIPGTVGGAIYGNAGAYGQTISDHLTKVSTLDPNQPTQREDEEYFLKDLSKNDCQFGYRESIFKKNTQIILEAEFRLTMGNSEDLIKESEEIILRRTLKYPPGIKCPGSFFKNIVADNLSPDILSQIPPEKISYGKIPSGALLEEVGAKGAGLGDIWIADYHANLFINKSHGTAKDFYNLASQYAKKVYRKYGIKLTPEVQLINLPPFNFD